MFNDRFAQLMARQLSGEASEEELQELSGFLSENPQAQYFYEVFAEYWSVEPSETKDDIQEEIHFQQIIAIAEKQTPEEEAVPMEEEPREYQPRFFSFKKLLIAATFIGIIATGYFLFPRGSKAAASLPEIPMNEVVAKGGARTKLLLPDGSKVWLNSESRLEYKTNFNDSIREVVLEGEAFFEVVKDKKRPFIVHTSDIDIRVLGTAFNVKSYPKESSIEATLIHGMIEVTNKKEPTAPKIIMRPHDKLVFNKDTDTEEKQPGDTHHSAAVHRTISITPLPRNIADTAIVETSWVYNKLVFDGESFREIALKMERWYDVHIIFRNEKIANVPIHVTFKDETIQEALRALQLIEPFTYKINGNEIEILKR